MRRGTRRERAMERERSKKPFTDETQFFNIDFRIHIIEMINKQREHIEREKEGEGETKRKRERCSAACIVSIASIIYHICCYCHCACVYRCACFGECHLHLLNFTGTNNKTATIAHWSIYSSTRRVRWDKI